MRCVEEGLFYGAGLTDTELDTLRNYVKENLADVAEGGRRNLHLYSRQAFAERLIKAACRARCLLVGFNLPFDISRIAFDASSARGRFHGGFSFVIETYTDPHGVEVESKYSPRITIKHIDNKRSLKGFTSHKEPDSVDLIPEGSTDGKPKAGYTFRGHILDLRTLVFALTDRGHSLASACKAFRVENGKIATTEHGKVSADYIDYNRQDVVATAELARKLFDEYGLHPIDLQATKAYSPASIGKDYLRTMGIIPVLERQPDFPPEFLGFAQSAFYGGRTSAKIRKVAVPVVYTDFLSMYPTVNNLMGLWSFVVAERIEVLTNQQDEVRKLLEDVNLENQFDPTSWKRYCGFVKTIPDGDILPVRSKYNDESGDWQVGVNHLYAQQGVPDPGLWYSIPDVVASVLLTGRIPKISDAFLIQAHGIQPGLKPVKLRGAIRIDPAQEDCFKRVIEERKRLKERKDVDEVERSRLDQTLKVLANSTSYGIYAETNRQEASVKQEVTCYGIDSTPFTCKVLHPEVPGAFCFPPLASLITGGARLMLALLEKSVTSLGGTYAMEDTDSMAIVANETGGFIQCDGGDERTDEGKAAIRALSWAQVKCIADRFAALNPYDRRAVPGSILKIEDDNFIPATKTQRQIHCLAISAKRYALFELSADGEPQLLRKGVNNGSDRWSEHGLGHLLNPTDPADDDREWIAKIWDALICVSLGRTRKAIRFARVPAVGRTTVSSPLLLRAFAGFNQGKSYQHQIKPFNFVLTAHVAPFGHPLGTDASRFHLIAPYETNPRRWLRQSWIYRYSGKEYLLATGNDAPLGFARVKSYGDVIEDYEFHPEAKCLASDGRTCQKQSVGLLSRRHVRIDQLHYIGKESNMLEEVGEGIIQNADEVYVEYVDPRRDECETKILPALRKQPLHSLPERTGSSRRALMNLRAGKSRPHRSNLERLRGVLELEPMCDMPTSTKNQQLCGNVSEKHDRERHSHERP